MTTTKTTSAPAPEPANGATTCACPTCGAAAPITVKSKEAPGSAYHNCCGRTFRSRLIPKTGRREYAAG